MLRAVCRFKRNQRRYSQAEAMRNGDSYLTICDSLQPLVRVDDNFAAVMFGHGSRFEYFGVRLLRIVLNSLSEFYFLHLLFYSHSFLEIGFLFLSVVDFSRLLFRSLFPFFGPLGLVYFGVSLLRVLLHLHVPLVSPAFCTRVH